MDSPPKVDLLEFRTQNECDLDFALSELSDNQYLSKERRIFLKGEIDQTDNVWLWCILHAVSLATHEE